MEENISASRWFRFFWLARDRSLHTFAWEPDTT